MNRQRGAAGRCLRRALLSTRTSSSATAPEGGETNRRTWEDADRPKRYRNTRPEVSMARRARPEKGERRLHFYGRLGTGTTMLCGRSPEAETLESHEGDVRRVQKHVAAPESSWFERESP